MQIELWIDVVCPWCYLGKRRLEAALEQFDARDELTLVTRSFQLDPDAPPVAEGTLSQMLASQVRHHRRGGRGAPEPDRRARQSRGIDFRFDLARSGNTFDAHRLIHLAREQGVASEVVERLMRGYFSEGLAIGDPAELAGAVAEAGLPQPEAHELLDGDDFAEEVRAEIQQAARLGIRGVPFLVLDGRYGLSGAQPADAYLQALEHAWGERQAA